MPIYEYLCEKCGSELEMVQKITDPPLAIHAECGGKLKRLISSSAFVLKGSGWYVTDYPSESRKKALDAKKDKGKTKQTGTKNKPKTETTSTPAPQSANS